MSGEICTDNRFEIIAAYKKKLIESTNIQSSPEEMAVIDNVLFRFWQMRWLPPIPHGRLIDADALSAKLNMMIAMAFGEGNTAFHFAYRSLGKVVENAPTIIPAEEGE